MSITYNFSIVAMDCYPEQDGQTDVVFTCHWQLNGTDGTYNGSVYGSVGVTYEAGSPFTPYADLTQSQVVGWVQAALGSEQVAAYEENVAQQIANQANPPVMQKSLPWGGSI
jgi:hypothetical protein